MKATTTKRKPRENAAMLPVGEVPPHDAQAERALIGCALVRDGSVAEVPAAAFYVERHRKVWEAVLELNATRGRSPDAYTVVSHLGLAGKDAAEVIDLAPLDLDPAGADVHAGRVVGAWEKREALVRMHGAARAAYDPGSSPEEVRRRLAGAMPTGGIEKAREVLAGLAAKVTADPGAAFEAVALDALALLKRSAPAEWQRARQELKAAGVRVRDLEDEVKNRGPRPKAPDAQESEELVRNVVLNGAVNGWFVSTRVGWVSTGKFEVRARVAMECEDADEIAAVIGSAVENPWRLVNRPFQPEYPEAGRRVWNRDAAQLAFTPASGPHPTWDAVLAHCGQGLDYAIAADTWCQANGVRSGADYLRLWPAALVQEPLMGLPYLFFHGPQNTGKTTYSRALSFLFTKGYTQADQALTSQGGFNGELSGALLCSVEETDLRNERAAAGRIKDWVTNPEIRIHFKGQTPFQQANTTHWIQTANKIDHCPVLPGDTRITAVAVPPLEGPEIPRHELEARLKAEAPAFLHTLLSTKIPPPKGRLRIPMIETGEKRDHMLANRSELEVFLDGRDDWLAKTPEEIAREFHGTLAGGRSHYWPAGKVARDLLDAEAHEKVGAPRRLARALRGWFEAGGRKPQAMRASEVLALLEGECSRWSPQKAAKHVGKVVGALRAVGIVLGFRDVAAGTEWRLDPCRLDMRVIVDDDARYGGDVA